MYTKKIYFSGGDFHELQEVFCNLPGVTDTRTGYINAPGEADFDSVAAGRLKAYMGVEVVFNPKKIDLSKLMDVFFAVVNPYVPDGQGQARGEMYRAGIFYADAEDEPQVELHVNFIASRGKPPAANCLGITMNDPNSDPRLARKCCCLAKPIESFQPAEPEHQHYFESHARDDTCIDFARLKACLKF